MNTSMDKNSRQNGTCNINAIIFHGIHSEQNLSSTTSFRYPVTNNFIKILSNEIIRGRFTNLNEICVQYNDLDINTCLKDSSQINENLSSKTCA